MTAADEQRQIKSKTFVEPDYSKKNPVVIIDNHSYHVRKNSLLAIGACPESISEEIMEGEKEALNEA